MDPWTVGLVALVVVGVAVIVYGALVDRAKNRRAKLEMLSPPPRDIPMFSPDSAPPQYLSELQARRPPTDTQPSDLSAEERAALKRDLHGPDVSKITSGWASKDFVTDHSASWAVLDSPAVLVCAEPVLAMRELIPLMEQLIMTSRPLVVVAPDLGPEVLATLEVNAIRQTMRLLAVRTSTPDQLEVVARATGAQLLVRSDLQSGYLAPDTLGTCLRWVSSAHGSYVLPTITVSDGAS